MQRQIFFAVIVSTLAAGSVVVAQGPRDRAGFEQFDADGNGEITQAELEARAAVRFAAADANEDGVVTVEELTARLSERAGDRAKRMVERLDANDDGQLTQDELAARRDPSRLMDRFDTDNSGGISKEEFAEARKLRRERRQRP